MLFNSIDFAVFLPIIFILYWFVFNKKLRLQNLLIVISSYVFYGFWDWRFLFLIFFSTLVDFFVGKKLHLEVNPKRRKLLLWLSITVNIGFLAYFKYYNFFLDNFIEAFRFFGSSISASSLQIILPVGISFYTFQTLSYTIDIYRKKLKPTNDFIIFSAFVSFFPQLVAGPIERATHLLPQFERNRKFNYNDAVDGMRQMLWGFFKKLVIADNCGEFADLIFSNPDGYSGSTLVLGAVFFSFQIYGDFSGYSDIAIGCSRLFGFDLKQNFNFPYFSRSIAEFWRKWHISLSSWFRDYLYIPLGGSRNHAIRNTFIIFIVSGFWHGPNWTFIVWGFLHAIYFLPLLLTHKNRNFLNTVAEGKSLPSFYELLLMVNTFILTTFAWIFFRSDSIQDAFYYIRGIIDISIFSIPDFMGIGKALTVCLLIVVLILVEWNARGERHAFAKLNAISHWPIRWIIYACILFLIGMFMQSKETPFIYFQF